MSFIISGSIGETYWHQFRRPREQEWLQCFKECLNCSEAIMMMTIIMTLNRIHIYSGVWTFAFNAEINDIGHQQCLMNLEVMIKPGSEA